MQLSVWNNKAALRNCTLRESCINVKIPKYGSRVPCKGIGSRFPYIGPRSQVKGPRWRVLSLRSQVWVPGPEFWILGPTFQVCLLKSQKCKLLKRAVLVKEHNSEAGLHIADFKLGVLKNFLNSTGKHLCWNLFLIKLPKGLQLY